MGQKTKRKKKPKKKKVGHTSVAQVDGEATVAPTPAMEDDISQGYVGKPKGLEVRAHVSLQRYL